MKVSAPEDQMRCAIFLSIIGRINWNTKKAIQKDGLYVSRWRPRRDSNPRPTP